MHHSLKEPKRIVVALEGLPCAGKTTFFLEFQKNNPQFFCVPELFINPIEGESSVETRVRYAQAEIEKQKRVRDIKKNILTDRSFLSTIAFSYAKYKTTGDNADYFFNLTFLKKEQSNIILPDFVVIFAITPQESIERRRRLIRDETLAFWKDGIFLQHFSDFYTKELKTIINEQNAFFLDTTLQNEKETYKLANKKIEEFSAS